MEAFGTAAAAIQIATFAAALVKSITRFTEQTKTITDSIHELCDEVSHLEAALNDLGETFSKRPQQLSFEYRHHDRIHRILESCSASLQDLARELPQLNDETTPIQKLRLSIQRSLKEERLKEIVYHITSYTRILQLSLSTLSLGELWINRQSQELILAEVRKINQAIRTSDLFSGRAETRARVTEQVPLLITPRPYTPPIDEEVKSTLEKEIREWRETVDEIAAAVSLSPNDDSADGRLTISLHSAPSSTTLETRDDDKSDSEQEELDEISRKILRRALEENQKIVHQLMQSEIYSQAAEYQRRGIKKCRRLDDNSAGQHAPNQGTSKILQLADMRETLADILLHCDTREADNEAEEVLEELLENEGGRSETDDADRQWRLIHKLGNIYASQGKFRKSSKFLRSAFMGRSRANPRHNDLVRESATALIKSLQLLQLIDDARGIQSWVEEELPPESHSEDPISPGPSPKTSVSGDGDLSGPYRWSMEQGFDIHSPKFGFDICDPGTGKAPFHLAIQNEDLEVLQSMLLSMPDVERRDSTGATPIHLAATTHNKRVCGLLLEKGANVNVLDQRQRSPLHKCQGSVGGVQVAELLLDQSPNLIDRVDCFGKTALYMACEKGNEKMASFLLSRGASPNKDGSGRFVPLIIAIDAVAQSRATIHLVKSLLDYGADARLRDGSGRSAFEAASNAGLAAGEIKKLLGDKLWRKTSEASMASGTNTNRTSSTSTGSNGSSASTGPRRLAANWLKVPVRNRPAG
ncbi:ankyrin [Nemania sp. FL0916]|nr:ankyrin [Nemania sp. FL0916]